MTFFLGTVELAVFLFMAYNALYNPSKIVDVAIYNFGCEIFNAKFFGSVPWINMGISLYSNDFFVLLLILIMLLRIKTEIWRNAANICLLIFTIMSLSSCIRGLMQIGATPFFFGDLRKFLYFAVAIWFFSDTSIEYNWQKIEKKLDHFFFILSLYLVVLLCLHFAGIRIGYYTDDRPLVSDYAIIYAAYIGFRWYRELLVQQGGKIKLSTLLMSLILVLNRYNTTWIALLGFNLVLFVFMAFCNRKVFSNFKFWLEVITIIGCVAIIMTVFRDGVILGELSSNVDKFDLSGDNSFTSRIEVWTAIVATFVGINAIIGFPFGNGYNVMYRGAIWQFMPHNGYIELAGRTGYIGLIAIIILIGWIIVKALRRKKVLPVCIVMLMLIYWIAYSVTLEQGILIGVCLMYLQKGAATEYA